MFADISNDESDHCNPMSSNPIIPGSQPENISNNAQEDDEREQGNPFFIGLITRGFSFRCQ
jgi:hypothetical protein